MDVVEITSCLYRAEAEAEERLPRLAVSILLDEPSGTLQCQISSAASFLNMGQNVPQDRRRFQ